MVPFFDAFGIGIMLYMFGKWSVSGGPYGIKKIQARVESLIILTYMKGKIYKGLQLYWLT